MNSHLHLAQSGDPFAAPASTKYTTLLGAIQRSCDLVVGYLRNSGNQLTLAWRSFFQTNRFPKTEAFFQRVLRETDAVVDAGKGFWMRPRPYLVDTNLLDGEMEKFSGSYRHRIVAL